MTTLTGARVVLREFSRGDVDATHAFGSDPVATRYLDWGPNTTADTQAFLDRTLAQQGDPDRDVFTLAVTLAASGALIGSCGVEVTDPANQRASMGYILHRDHRGHGYATETARLLVGFAFDELGLPGWRPPAGRRTSPPRGCWRKPGCAAKATSATTFGFVGCGMTRCCTPRSDPTSAVHPGTPGDHAPGCRSRPTACAFAPSAGELHRHVGAITQGMPPRPWF